MMESKTSIPKLRFPEFKGEWERKKMAAIAKFTKGKGISKVDISEDGATECIRYGELYTRYSEVIDDVFSKTDVDVKNLVLSEANDVIIPASGETQIDIATASCVIKSGIALGGDLNIIKTANNGVFLSYYLNNRKKIEIANLAQGISVVHLYSSQLATLNLNLPTLPEQTRIASFFTVLDKRIDELKQKKSLLDRYKKGLMQILFSQELRFKDANGNEFPKWEKKPLGDLLDYIQPTKYLVESTEYDDSYVTPVLTAGKSFILGYTNETFGIYTEQLPVIIFDDFTTAIQFVDFPFKAKSSAMKLLVPKNNSNIHFIFEAMQLIEYAIGGHERHWISKYAKIEMPIPCPEEQNRISDFLNSVNTKLSQTENQIQQTQQYKKGLLNNMLI